METVTIIYKQRLNQENKLIDDTLKEREKRYGKFKDHARISQNIKYAMEDGNWNDLTQDKREALEMIAHKIARVLNGDSNYSDNWHDIIGYARLVEIELDENKSEKYNKQN